jgi:hypothetical protein
MALLTAAEFRGYYPLLTGTAEDTAVDTVVSAVGALMARTCGYPRTDAGTWTMESATYTKHYDGPTLRHPRCLDLGLWPVVSVTSAHADADWAYGADTLIASGDLVLDGARGLLWIAPTTTGSAALPSAASHLSIGNRAYSVTSALGCFAAVAAVQHFPRRLSNADLQTLTSG